ncbi:hypothetical protein Acsp06_16490 [Actinomycetospora sp. NBRC 106375]|uniref:DUF6325 family protein n=1 Tax=Actinomycetospora sp. NBRC 106375 TaxID=3032207 RepID=UPI0024A12739|nr:DUF6325 family protein [Actinomycetospora sp. NBRC 106375]GLZ45464.1 hypothetical protein Acsp06_16490 [Actinomycetospora sp. NBRC 106375]
MSEPGPDTGPIDYLIIEFPPGTATGEGMPLLIDLVDRGLIRILDLVFVGKGEDGSVSGLELADLDGDGALDLTVFHGASSGLLGDEDVAEAGTVIEPGTTAAVLVYENVWAAPLAGALRRSGAQLVAGGRIPVDDVVASLENTVQHT